MDRLKKSLLTLIFINIGIAATPQSTSNWTATLGENKAFIKNEGQFAVRGESYTETAVTYAHDGVGEDFLFSNSGVILEFSHIKRAVKSDAEKKARKARKLQGFNSLEEWQEFERAGTRLDITYDQLQAVWVGANPNVTIIPGEKKADYHSYFFKDASGKSVNANRIPGYKTLTYKNLYPNIDVVYEFHPEGGLKYSVIIHPGGDLSQVKLQYSKDIELLPNGTIETNTTFGSIIDHAPLTFYEDNHQNVITSSYQIDGNSIGFQVGNYNHNKTLIIDPWTQSPAFNTNWDCVWECERDASGNSYLIGGVMPLQLIKYNAAGAPQWTYNTPYDTTAWLGVFATDDLGNSYVTNGSTAQIQKINTGGGVVWDNPNPGGLFSSTEFWNIAFNCDQTKLIVGGTGGFLPPEPYIYDIDMNSGNVTASIKVTESTIAGFPPNTQEVRSVTATSNEKYYFLTHDSIGYINQNLTLCPGASAPFHVENGGYDLGYKCENWRYNNTGIEALAHYGGFIFVNRGDRLDKRDFNTANIIATAPIPGGTFTNVFLGGNVVENSGIEIDDCGNIYVGSGNGVVKFDQNLAQLATYPTAFNVYDVAVTSTGDVVAGGSTGDSGSGSRTGSLQSFAASACTPQVTICCNPTICAINPLCTTDPPVTLTPFTTGGTWSAAPGFNQTTGVFDPAASGPGTFTIYYTLACGMDSIVITVSACNPMSVCVEANGDLTVSGGTGPFDWQEPTTTQDCSACLVGCIIPPGCAVNVLSWTSFASGTTVTPYVGADSVLVVDGLGNTLYIYDISTLPPCSAVCDATITPAGPFCLSTSSVTLVAAMTGGTWTGTGITNSSNGTFDPATAGVGSHVVTYTLGCGDSDTETIVVNALDDASFTYAQTTYCVSDPDPLPIITGLGGGSFTATAGIVFTDGSPSPTGTIDISSSTVGGPYTITYTTNGPCPNQATFNITIVASANATITPAGPFCVNDPSVNLSAVTGGGQWTGTGITDTNLGTFDPATAGVGSHIVTYTITGSCGATDTETIVVNAADDPSFTYPQGSYCLTDPNPTPTVTGLLNGSFSIDNSGTINSTTGEIDLLTSGIGSYIVTYVTNGPCPDSTTFNIIITTGANATITPAGPFCLNDPTLNLVAVDNGGQWTGTGITDANLGTFDPATAGVGSHIITYTITGSCGDTDTETIVVNAADDPSFTYPQNSYCPTDPNPFPTVTGLNGGSFSIDNSGTVDINTGEIDLAASGLGSYIVTYVTNGPCPDSTTFNVTITNAANATITPAGPFCANDPPLNLQAVDNGGQWTGTGITDANLGTFDPATAGVGSHIITYTITGSCGDTDTETIVVNAADDPSFTYAQNTYCLTDPDPTPTVSGLTGGDFSIDNSGSIDINTGQIDLNTSGPGTYIVTYVTNGPCPDSTTFNITISNAFDATITPAGPFCSNDPAVTLVGVDNGGNWTGPGITNATAGTFDPATAGPGSHTVTYTISGSCGDTDTETIVVNPQDDASFTYPATTYCISDPNPTATVTGLGGGNFTINNGGSINGTTGEIDLTTSGVGTYMVYYTTNGPCPAIDSASVTITNQSDASITPAGPFCLDEIPQQLVSANGGGTWSGTGVNSSGIFNPTTAGPGTWEIIYTISGSCGDADTIQVVVNSLPTANAGMDTTIVLGNSVTLNAQGGSTYVWSPSTGLSCTTCPNPIASPTTTTTYCVTVTDANGCTAIDCITVNVLDIEEEIFTPNIFSPNGDGNNDVFYVEGSGLNEFNLKIFNRWGEVVYESTIQSQGWDGTQHEKMLNSGVFVFLITYNDAAGDEQVITGNVTLIR
jgi:gliding motility-associated-like protein